MEPQLLGSFPDTAVPAKWRVVRLRMLVQVSGREPESFVPESDSISSDGKVPHEGGNDPVGQSKWFISKQPDKSQRLQLGCNFLTCTEFSRFKS